MSDNSQISNRVREVIGSRRTEELQRLMERTEWRHRACMARQWIATAAPELRGRYDVYGFESCGKSVVRILLKD